MNKAGKEKNFMLYGPGGEGGWRAFEVGFGVNSFYMGHVFPGNEILVWARVKLSVPKFWIWTVAIL